MMAMPVMHSGVGEQLHRALIADLDSGFAEVVRTYERVGYSVALRLSSRPADAEDLAAEAQRAAVVLRHVIGLPTSEVADVLGCPDGTAKSHISRGLHRLRALLTNQTGDELVAGRTVR